MAQESSVIFTLGLTGGPCGGKTTAIGSLETAAREMGWSVVVSHEPATIYFTNNPGSKERLLKAFTEVDIDVILEIESAITAIALEALSEALFLASESGGKWLIIVDRPIPDNMAYLPLGEVGRELYWKIIRKFSLTSPWDTLFLYDAIIKMTSAANGAEHFYECESNEKRHESLKEARALDMLFEKIYAGHPRFYVIDNSTGFEEKILRLISVLQAILQEELVNH